MKKPTPVNLTIPGGHAIRIAAETITPDLARAYLLQNLKNRKPRPRQVEILRREIAAGGWQFTHQGIAFGEPDPEGREPLLDGQHRLLAIVAADKSIDCLVFRNLPVKAQEATDMGQSRSVAENLSLFDGEVNTSTLLTLTNATAQCWARFDGRVSLPQTREILRLFPDLRLLAKLNVSKIPTAFKQSPVKAVVGIAIHKWRKETAAFADAYERGLGLTENHPSHHLRNYCLTNYESGFPGRQALFSFATDCLQHFITGTPMDSPKPTGTGLKWLRAEMATEYTALCTALRLL